MSYNNGSVTSYYQKSGLIYIADNSNRKMTKKEKKSNL